MADYHDLGPESAKTTLEYGKSGLWRHFQKHTGSRFVKRPICDNRCSVVDVTRPEVEWINVHSATRLQVSRSAGVYFRKGQQIQAWACTGNAKKGRKEKRHMSGQRG